MKAAKALAVGVVLGFLVALAGSCSSSTCGPQNCGGCCDTTTKKCVLPAAQTATECGGILGGACGVCSANQTCTNAVCTGGGNDGGTGCGACPIGCCATAQNGTKFCATGTGLSNATCGSGGAVCQACQSGFSCQVSAAGDGTCVMNGPDGGPSGGVGFPCTTAADCMPFLGSSAVCLTTTPDGGGTYVDGYCTVLSCNPQTNVGCPGNSLCIPFGSLGFGGSVFPGNAYGENRTFCVMGCASDFDCLLQRSDQVPDYSCWFGNQFDTATQQFTTGNALGCFINQKPTTAKAGNTCNWGSTITNAQYSECALPPTNGQCVPPVLPDGGLTGWTGGYCFSSCLASVLFANGNDYCGPGAECVVDSNGTTTVDGVSGLPVSADCYSSCGAPNGGQSTCRGGYVCIGLVLTDGGLAPTGICQPACDAPGSPGCNAGFTCVGAVTDGGTADGGADAGSDGGLIGNGPGYCCGNATSQCQLPTDCCSGVCTAGVCG